MKISLINFLAKFSKSMVKILNFVVFDRYFCIKKNFLNLIEFKTFFSPLLLLLLFETI